MINKLPFLLFILLVLGNTLLAGSINIHLDLETPATYEYNDFIRFQAWDMIFPARPGSPELPEKPILVLLPPGEKALSASIVSFQEKVVNTDKIVFPSQQPYPLSYDGIIEFTYPAAEIYEVDQPYPRQKLSLPCMCYYQGFAMCYVNLAPLAYNPVRKELHYLTRVEIIVETEPAGEAGAAYQNFYRGRNKAGLNFLNRVHNPEMILQYPELPSSREETYDYIIITSSVYESDFSDFCEIKQQQGYYTMLKTTEEISLSYTGNDLQEKIRNFIIYAYQNMGTAYILLGGDTEIIPHRGFYVAAGTTIDYDMPSDLYYAGLDRVGSGAGPDWNVDNDSYWGETSEADYLADIWVGRISADSHAEFTAALNKQVMYQEQPVTADLEKAIMVGENLNNSPLTWGGTYKDEIINGGIYNGFYTTGFPVNFNLQTQYDRSYYWNWTELRDKLNNGVNLVNHLGHSNVGYNMKFYTSYVTNSNLTSDGVNHNFYIMYSQGCYPASLDNRDPNGNYGSDCIVEQFTTIDNGCVAFVGNSRYGWYNPGGTDSGSQYLDRQFFDALFGENIYTISGMHEDARFDGASQCNGDPWFRWAFYELIVFGDPALDVWTANPAPIIVSYPPSVPLGTQQVSISSNAPSARVALIQNDTLLATAVTDGSGNATLNLTDPVTIAEELDLFLHAHNRNPCENTIIVVSNQPYVVNNSFSIDDSGGNGNGEGDFDEFITIAIMLQNVGDQPAQEVIAALNCNDNYFVITDAFEAAGYLGSGDSILLNGAFAGYIADNIPDQHQLLLDLLINDADENSWQYTIPLTVNAPDLQYQTINIDDSDFNNNGRLDPGENVELTVQILNQGHAASPLITVSLTCVEPEIDINPPSLQLTGLDAGEQTAAIFSASIGDMIPPGTPVTFSLETGSGNYTFTHEFILSVGLILDDFESGNMFTMNWENSGNLPWFIESDNPWEGEFCLCSGDITHNQTSVLSITVQVLAGSDLSFMRKVSSENNYDYLRFYIDDVLRDQWSGDRSWSQVTYPVDIGEHSFQWVYYKDGSLSSGNDCAWIDYIIFPYIELPGQPDITLAPTSLEFDLLPGNSQQENFVIYNEGNAELEYEMEVQYDSFQSSGRSWSDPDEYGYIWIDSDDPEGPPYNWYELNPAAIPVTFTHNDVSTDLIPLDFSLSFYGESYTSFRISPNGWIGFSNDWSDYHNYAIPRQDAPRAAIFGFWDDLDPLQGGDVYYLQNQDSLIVWFDDVIHYPGIYTGIYDFEIIVYRDGNILCQYNSMTGDLDSATIGIHNLTGDDALQVVYNNNYVHDQLAVFFQKPLTWLEINPHQGTIPEYAQIEINVTSDAGELPPGYYYADILINSNDPDQSCLLLPVTLAINDETLEIPSQIRTHISGNSLVITWNAVDGASSYLVFAADSPYDDFQYVTTVYTNSCLMPLNQSKRFFRITAAN